MKWSWLKFKLSLPTKFLKINFDTPRYLKKSFTTYKADANGGECGDKQPQHDQGHEHGNAGSSWDAHIFPDLHQSRLRMKFTADLPHL